MNKDEEEGEEEEDLKTVKITLLGNAGVGKTSIILRYTKDDFDEYSNTTRGANYSPKTIVINDTKMRLDIWDTAGQEQYRSLGKHFYKDSYIVILVYDITSRQSFEDLKNMWYEDLNKYGEKYTVMAIVGNKCDLFEEEEIPEEEARKFAEEKEAIFMLVSAKGGDNINNLFNILVRKYLEPNFQIKNEERMKQEEMSVKLRKMSYEDNKKKIKKSQKGCC